ncbi:LamG-like jellyroll fold domain-containing protein [Streptacidiphilus sp. P02-A3a]|uniref:LamG-like jellyroll fold domain-containing protein n=1 Tax=Streptacidiphilus sp. P02-A3a TaxID=2704468 RepID=UPI0015FD99CA|nr:LamG-like jellyroll fold domain-containing protein [Streptacidiphilus sp. P02-A3a]QMU70027.1 hypothetical protein GXP74_19140 [Streptacidiphilus sp. P02-A3a]
MTTSSLSFSNGGGGPLAVMRSGDSSLTVSLPADLGTLPRPTLSGDTATYAGVLPGVDLELTADEQGGYSEVLVVRNAAAAADPALRTLVLPTQVTGAKLSADAAGNITATTPQGRTVFSAPEPLMWDSQAPVAGKAPRLVTDPRTGAAVDAATGQPATSSPAMPGEDAHVAGIATRASAHTITLVPNAALLAGHHTVYPLYLDPSFAAGGVNQDWTFVDSYYDNASYWKNTGVTAMHVGDEEWSGPYSVDRTFAQFSVSPDLYGASVSSSTFYATETWSASCTAEPVQLWWTGSISSGTTWNNQPAWNSDEATDNIASGWSSSCPADSHGWTSSGLTSLMQTAATGRWANVTLGLRAGDESNTYNWEEFDPSTMSMTTVYDKTPNTPTALSTNPASRCGGAVTTLGNGSISLIAQVSSPDKGNLTAEFKSWETNASSTALDNANLAVVSGTDATLIIPETTLIARSGKTSPMEFSWDVAVTDGTLTSGTSKTCSFTFNPAAPGAPALSDSSGADCNASTLTYTVGDRATFTVAPSASGATPSNYVYQINGGAAVSTTQTTLTVIPTRATNVLTVTAVAAGGNIGDSATCVIEAAAPATAADGDLNGDGLPDLITVGNKNGLPPGLWQADSQSAGTGQVATQATDIGAQGTGIDTAISATSPQEWNGLEAFTGHFATGGSGFNDVATYNPSDGTATILDGNGDGSALQIANEQDVVSGAFTDGTGSAPVYATHLANAGNLNNTASGNTGQGGNIILAQPDLLMTIDGSLYLSPSADTPGGYFTFGSPSTTSDIDLLDTNPTGTGNWNGWTITTSLVATTPYTSLPALFARDDSTGALYYYSPTATLDLAQNVIQGTNTTVTPVELETSGWGSTTYPVIEGAEFGGSAGLWGVSSTGATTDVTAASISGSTLTTTVPQQIAAEGHTWALDDNTTGTVTTAADTTGNPALTLTGDSGTTWDTGDANFPADVAFNGTSGSLSTTSAAVDLTRSFTLSAWAKPTSYGGAVISQSGSSDFGMVVFPSATGWQFQLNTGSGTGLTYDVITGGTVNLGAWAHLTAIYNATTKVMDLYVDDVHVATGPHTAPSTGADGDFLIGSDLYQGAGSGHFAGDVAQVQTWSGAVVPPAQPYTAAGYHQSVTATRILDTRYSTDLSHTTGITAGSATVAAGSVTALQISGDTVTPSSTGSPTTIPTSVTAVAVDVTAVNESTAGYLTAYADNTQQPVTSSTNYVAGTTVTGNQIVPVGTDGKIDLYASGGPLALVVDLTGYFTSDATVANDQTYTPLGVTQRVLDTGSSVAGTSLSGTGPVAANSSFTLQVTGAEGLLGVPAGATAVAANITTYDETGVGGLSVYATGAAPANLTSLTYTAGTGDASMAADTPLSSGGTITIADYGSATDVIVDVSGYYTNSTTGETYHTVNPTRIVDTRNGTGGSAGQVASDTPYLVSGTDIQQVTTAAVPTLVGVLTATDATGSGFAVAYANGLTRVPDGSSSINWVSGVASSNLIMTPTGNGDGLDIYNNSSAPVDFVLDSSGYFA